VGFSFFFRDVFFFILPLSGSDFWLACFHFLIRLASRFSFFHLDVAIFCFESSVD